MHSGFWRERDTGSRHWSQPLMLVLLSNLLITWTWGLDRTNRSTVGQEAGRAWAWPEVSRLTLAGASLEIMLPSCNTVWQWLNLCSHLNWAILGCYSLKQWDWESGDRVIFLSRTARSPGEKQWPTSACRQPYWKQLSRTPRYFLLVNSMWLTRSIFFFFLSKSRFLSVSSDRRKAWNSECEWKLGEPVFINTNTLVVNPEIHIYFVIKCQACGLFWTW